MPQSTIDLVKSLITQLNLFTEMSAAFGPDLQGADLTFSASLSYSRLRFTIERSKVTYFQYTLQELTSGAREVDCYYHDRDKIEVLKKYFEPLMVGSEATSARNASGKFKYTGVLGKYLTIAESIAAGAYLCTTGDDYWPGYFSEIAVHDEGITLKQINHMNARSLDHKQDYALRDLEFFIPVEEAAEKLSVGLEDDYIGAMRIHFSDRSSENRKTCGDKIRERIEEEKLAFLR